MLTRSRTIAAPEPAGEIARMEWVSDTPRPTTAVVTAPKVDPTILPPLNMAEISLHKRQRIRLIVDSYCDNYVIILFLSNVSCLQLCQMFYRGQLCELDFQILDSKQCRPHPKFPIRFTPLVIAAFVAENLAFVVLQ